MPSDVHEIYPFVGTVLGSIGTCEAQGFLSLLGTGFTLVTNSTLHLYFVCTLRFKMTEEKFKKWIMPAMFALATALSITFPMFALRNDLINPSPVYGICFVIPYPFGCSNKEVDQEDASSIECIRGIGTFDLFYMLGPRRILFGAVLVVMVVSLLLVIISVFEAEINIRKSRRIQNHTLRYVSDTSSSATRSNRHERRMDDFKRTRSAMIQALMYIAAFLLTYVWSFIFMAKFSSYTSESGPSNILSLLQTIFSPLQGFFNAVIFVYQKTYTLRRTKTDLSFFGAFKQVICEPSNVPQEVISSIEIAIEDIGERRENDTLMRRGQSSVSLRERVQTGANGMRRLGSDMQYIGPTQSDLQDAVGGGGCDSSSSGPSNDISIGDISLRDILGPDYNGDDLITMAGRNETSVSVDSQSLPNEEDLSSGGANLSVSENTSNLSVGLCSVIPEGSHEDSNECSESSAQNT